MCFVTLAAAAAGTAVAGATAAGTAVGATTAALASLGTLGGLAVDVALVGAAASIGSSVSQSKAASDAADFNKKAAEQRADEERNAGERRAGRVMQQGRELASSQVAALGASGFDVRGGNSIDIINDTLTRAALDANEERRTGSLRGQAAEVDGINAQIAGRSARNRAAGQIAGTVLSTTGSVATSWYRFTR